VIRKASSLQQIGNPGGEGLNCGRVQQPPNGFRLWKMMGSRRPVIHRDCTGRV
jgi:hypothetical protein